MSQPEAVMQGASRSITIDEDIYAFLLRNAHEIGESASSILRRLLRLPGAAGEKAATTTPVSVNGKGSRSDQLLAFLGSSRLRAERSVTHRFLAVLAFLHDQNRQDFEQILKLSGRRRVYFANSREAIEKSGRSTFPREIPGTGYWVMTNTDTVQKKDLLERVLQVLGYDEQGIAAARLAVE